MCTGKFHFCEVICGGAMGYFWGSLSSAALSETQAFRFSPQGFVFFFGLHLLLHRCIGVCLRAGTFRNVCVCVSVCYTVGDAASRPSASRELAAFKRSSGLPAGRERSPGRAVPPFVFQQELALSGDAKHSSSDKGRSHPRSGLLW